MATDWPLLTIAECASEDPYSTQIGPFGKALTPEAYKPSGVPLLRGVNVNSGRFHDDDYVYISDEDADRLYKFESFPGDVLLVHKGTLGPIGLMPENRKYARYIMGNSMMRVRCDRSKLLPEYLRYWLKSPAGQGYLLSRVSQVGVPQLQRPLTTLREATLPVPPIPVQEQIVGVLGPLDDKIEQNRRTGRALEGLARATFKAWFVDFELVKAKAAGATSFPGMPSAAFAALPDRLTDSSIGPVPEGWEVRPLSEVCQIVSGGTPKRSEADYWGGSIPWYSVKDAPPDGMPWVYLTNEQITQAGLDGSAATLVPVGCTIISARGTVGRLALAGRSMTFNQSCYGLLPKDGKSYRHLYLLVRQVVSELQQRTHGSVFDTITRQTFDGVDVVLPPSALIEHFELAVTPLFDLLLALLWESRKLGELRDYLLPRLLSGTVRVAARND